MALGAARHALTSGGVDPAGIDLVIVASTTAEQRSPNVAGLIAADLGIPGAAVIDVNVACSGFVHALALADMSIRTGAAHRGAGGGRREAHRVHGHGATARRAC